MSTDHRPFKIVIVTLLAGILFVLLMLYNKDQTPKLIPVTPQPIQPEKVIEERTKEI